MVVLDNFTLTQFDFLRHGECEGGNIFRGSTDVSLTPSGKAAMHRSCEEVREPWDQIISSPLLRCRNFAEEFAQQQKLPLHIDQRIAEISFGDWEGRLRNDIWQHETAHILAWMENPADNTPPGGEPLTQVAERGLAFFNEASTQHRAQRILVIAHGGMIRVLLASLLNMPLRCASQFDVPFASVSRINIYEKDKSRLVKLSAHNFTGHKG